MSDQHYMRRALELAELGLGRVSPNPMVGCVIVCEGRIIGEGYHDHFGGPHAEVNAINSVRDQSLLTKSTMYVTLEPCSHFGKTPPCADLVIRHRLKRVVICNEDPFPLVAGKGIHRLKEAGIEVEVGLLQAEGADLNRRFFTSCHQMRPYVILKWAETTDGYVARENFDSKWISNQYSRQLVHKWRSEEDAILVGTNTARYDDPALTVRDWHGRNPVRVVIDRKRSLNNHLNLFDGKARTLCFTETEGPDIPHVEFVYLPDLSNSTLLAELQKRNIGSIIIEGGSQVLRSFIEDNLWDEARIFVSEKTFGAGIAAPKLKAQKVFETNIFHDRLTIYKR